MNFEGFLTIVSGAYNSAVTSGTVILTMQKRRV